MPRKTTANAAKDELLAEFQALVADTDSLKRARDTLRDTKDSLKDNVRERSQAAVDATEVYVGEHPWQSIGIAAGVGFLLGLLVSRR